MNTSSSHLVQSADSPIPIILVYQNQYQSWLQEQPETIKNWLSHNSFRPEAGSWCLLPGEQGEIMACILVVEELDIWSIAGLPKQLPEATYRLEGVDDKDQISRLALGWGLGSYRYDRYLGGEQLTVLPSLLVDSDAIRQQVISKIEAIGLVRDLVNTPAQDMMPEHLSEAARELAKRYDARFSEILDEALLEQNYPAIHAVGRASVHRPRLLEIQWGEPEAPLLTLVGKGVCFDSGGLDLKPANAMRLMKKDMGGAAHALGLAQMIMAQKLPLRLQVLIPAVENAVSDNAFRPGDVLQSRKGLSIEIDNTDAEGRLVLCDALTRAAEKSPDLLIDFATLTGAARVALGTEVPAFFTRSDRLANQLQERASDWNDMVWRLPLHDAYNEQIKSTIADIVNSSKAPFGGAITAALFLQNFIEEGQEWIHFDLMAWNLRERPGRPEGGEAMGLLGLFALIQERYA